MNYIASSAANGSIGYVEYSYPLSVGYPVAKVLNSGRLLHAARPSTTWPLRWSRPRSTWTRARRTTCCRTEQRLHRPRPADLSAVVVLVHDRADRGVPSPETQDHNSASGRRSPTSSTTPSARARRRSARSDIRRCRSTWSRPLRSDPEAADGGPERRPDNVNIHTCHKPTFVAGQPNANYLAKIAPAAAGLRPARRRPVRRRRDAERPRRTPTSSGYGRPRRGGTAVRPPGRPRDAPAEPGAASGRRPGQRRRRPRSATRPRPRASAGTTRPSEAAAHRVSEAQARLDTGDLGHPCRLVLPPRSSRRPRGARSSRGRSCVAASCSLPLRRLRRSRVGTPVIGDERRDRCAARVLRRPLDGRAWSGDPGLGGTAANARASAPRLGRSAPTETDHPRRRLKGRNDQLVDQRQRDV